MEGLWRNFCERLEHEAAAVHGGMRNLQAWFLDDRIAEQHDIDIDNARSFVAPPNPAHFLFNIQQGSQQLRRSPLRLQCRYAIEEPWLICEFHRFGLIETGDLRHHACMGYRIKSRLQIGHAITKIGPQRKIDSFRQTFKLRNAPQNRFYGMSCGARYLGYFRLQNEPR